MSDSKSTFDNDTLTFVNEEMTYEEVKVIFERFGEIINMNKYQKRFFVQFETPRQALKAQIALNRIYRVTFAHAKSRPRPKKNFRAEGELIRFYNPEDLPSTGYRPVSSEEKGMAMIEEYIRTATRNRNCDAAQIEMAKSAENRRDMAKKYQNLKENIKSCERESKRAENQDQHGEPASPRPSTSKVLDPEHDDYDDNIEELNADESDAGNTKVEKSKAENPKAEKSKAENTKAEKSKAKSKAEKSKAEKSKAEKSKTEKSKAQKPKAKKPKSQKPKAEKSKAENHQAEEEAEEGEYVEAPEDEEDDLKAQIRALSDGGRRKVRTEGFDEIMNALGNEIPFSVIVANIPSKYTLNELYDLVEEVKPIAFSEMDYSIKMKVKFCEVFVNDAADVNYLKRKLNDFVICGKQLTVMEPAEILDETRWNA